MYIILLHKIPKNVTFQLPLKFPHRIMKNKLKHTEYLYNILIPTLGFSGVKENLQARWSDITKSYEEDQSYLVFRTLRNIKEFYLNPVGQLAMTDDFFATLEMAGPQLTTPIKGDWIGLYRKFFRTPNFKAWFHARYTELTSKLQALHLEALSKADLKDWVQGKPEVEVVDMVIKIKNKINKCQENDIPVSDIIKEQLSQRLNDILNQLPEDLKNILQVS